MRVSDDRIKEITDAMREDAISSYSSGSASRYSFSTFCTENGIFNSGNAERRGADILISCPFHSDSTPSCHLNDSLWLYNCFGCRGGNFLGFRYRYLTEIKGERISWNQMVDRMLREDSLLSARLGYSSIYVKDEENLDTIQPLTQKRFKARKMIPRTYLEMLDMFLKKNPTVEQKKLFITLMQKEVPVSNAWNEFFGESGNQSSSKSYDLQELNTFNGG